MTDRKASDFESSQFKVGQYVHIDRGEGYRGGVVIHVYDTCIIVRESNGNNFRQDFGASDRMQVRELTRNGKPVMARKNIFGRHICKPEKN